jgi:hypothetical protein
MQIELLFTIAFAAMVVVLVLGFAAAEEARGALL